MSTVIALVTDAFGGFGGIAQYNRDLLVALADSPKVDRVVVVPRVVATPPDDVPAAIEHHAEAAGSLVNYARTCAKMMHRELPQLILCGHINLLPFAVPLAIRFKAPLALMVYGIDVWQSPRLASSAMLGRVDHMISISRLTIDKMSNWSDAPDKSRLSIIPNAVDLRRFYASENKSPDLQIRYGLCGKRVLMTLARMASRERYKGVREVLDAMPELLQNDPDLMYLVVGDGTDLPNIRDYAASLSLGEHVVFAGRIEEAEKVAHYQLADVFVMPGRGEGFGFVFLEAMACGIPVVASVLDGSREAVRYGALGGLCDPRDPESTVAAIRSALAKGRGSPPAGIEYFSIPEFRKRVHAFVDSVL